MSTLNLPGMYNPRDDGLHQKFKPLKNVLKSDAVDPYIFVTKGIHQGDGKDVHFTFQIAPAGIGEGSYHVFLVSRDLESVKTKDVKATLELVQYNLSGITYKAKATGNIKWPAAFQKAGLNLPHRQRGTSFSIGISQAIIAAMRNSRNYLPNQRARNKYGTDPKLAALSWVATQDRAAIVYVVVF